MLQYYRFRNPTSKEVEEFLPVTLGAHPGLGRAPRIEWNESALSRVAAYLRTFGIEDKARLTALTQQVMRRVDARVEEIVDNNPLPLAIEETQGMIDEWLSLVLYSGFCPHPQELSSLRVALQLYGKPKGWSDVFLQTRNLPNETAYALRETCLRPVPPLAELPMNVQEIEFWSSSLSSSRLLRYGGMIFAMLLIASGLLSVISLHS